MYLKESRYGGIDWHDSNTRSRQLTWNGNFEIPQENMFETVINTIVEDWKGRVSYTVEEFKEIIKNAFTGTNTVVVPLLDDGKECATDNIDGNVYYETCLTFRPMSSEKENCYCAYYEEYMWGQVSYINSFYQYDIDDPCYVVQENFLAPTKGCDSVERIYVDVFKSLDEAKKYFETLEVHDKSYNLMGSVKELLVASYAQISGTEWYKLNTQAIKLMEEKKQTPFDTSFRIFVKGHIEQLEQL